MSARGESLMRSARVTWHGHYAVGALMQKGVAESLFGGAGSNVKPGQFMAACEAAQDEGRLYITTGECTRQNPDGSCAGCFDLTCPEWERKQEIEKTERLARKVRRLQAARALNPKPQPLNPASKASQHAPQTRV